MTISHLCLKLTLKLKAESFVAPVPLNRDTKRQIFQIISDYKKQEMSKLMTLDNVYRLVFFALTEVTVIGSFGFTVSVSLGDVG